MTRRKAVTVAILLLGVIVIVLCEFSPSIRERITEFTGDPPRTLLAKFLLVQAALVLGVAVVFAVLPAKWQKTRKDLMRKLAGAWDWANGRWRLMPRWARTLSALVLAVPLAGLMFLAGTALGIISLVPELARTVIVLWMRATVLPWLARLAAGRGFNAIFVELWRVSPPRLREWIQRRYRQLWWKTLRRLVRARLVFQTPADRAKKRGKTGLPALYSPAPWESYKK